MIALYEKHIFNGLGKINDTVFDRTFSAEVAACIIYKHRKLLFDSDLNNTESCFTLNELCRDNTI